MNCNVPKVFRNGEEGFLFCFSYFFAGAALVNGAARRDPTPRDSPWPSFEKPPTRPVEISSALSNAVSPAPSTGFVMTPGWTDDEWAALPDIRLSKAETISAKKL